MLSTPLFVVVRIGATIGTSTVSPQRAVAGQVGSPPPLALAVLLPVAALAATATFKVNVVLDPTAGAAVNVPVKVQLRLLVPAQLQLLPTALVKVIPMGNTSATTILPVLLAVPLLTIVIV